MSNFVKDTLMIDEKIDIKVKEVKGDKLQAVILPYFVDPDSNELTVVLKRTVFPGAYARTGKKMGLVALTVDLNEDEPLTIEQVWKDLNLSAAMQDAIPFGGVMPYPETSNMAYELILIQTEPFDLIDNERGLIYQEKGKYEIGIVKFGEIVEGIQSNLIQDLKTRLILNELYVLALEESTKSQDPNHMNAGNENMIGGGNNLPTGYGEQDNTMKTSDIPDEILDENAQMDYGSIYAKSDASSGFKTAINKE
jgi:hypothetical protein